MGQLDLFGNEDDPGTIDRFDGPHAFLSNFAPSRVTFDGEDFPTVEHAFQAAKTLDPTQRARIRDAATPGKAKRLGRRVTLRDEWQHIRLAVMEQLLRQKFAAEPHKTQLLATGETRLIEGNHWGDTFWGVCEGEGLNRLGRLLEGIRSDLRSADV